MRRLSRRRKSCISGAFLPPFVFHSAKKRTSTHTSPFPCPSPQKSLPLHYHFKSTYFTNPFNYLTRIMKVTLSIPFATIHGSIDKSSPFYYKVQNGHPVLAHKPRRTPKAVAASTSQQAVTRQKRFAELNRLAAEILRTTTLRADYEERFCQQQQYATLRGFIMHCLSESL